jgi:ribonuclease R
MCLTGENSGVKYRVGDLVTVQVAAVNLDEKKIDLIMDSVGDNKPQKTSKKPKTSSKSKVSPKSKVSSPKKEKSKAKKRSARKKRPGKNARKNAK